jgi:hypothetical protein
MPYVALAFPFMSEGHKAPCRGRGPAAGVEAILRTDTPPLYKLVAAIIKQALDDTHSHEAQLRREAKGFLASEDCEVLAGALGTSNQGLKRRGEHDAHTTAARL